MKAELLSGSGLVRVWVGLNVVLVVQLSGRSLLTGVDSGTVTSTDCIAPDLMQG